MRRCRLTEWIADAHRCAPIAFSHREHVLGSGVTLLNQSCHLRLTCAVDSVLVGEWQCGGHLVFALICYIGEPYRVWYLVWCDIRLDGTWYGAISD